MGKWRLVVAVVSVCILVALSIVLVDIDSPNTDQSLSTDQNGLDTVWHIDHQLLPDEHPSKGTIETGERAWRYVRPAKPGEALPGGATADSNDVLWEWRMEYSNISDKPAKFKAGFALVTADENLQLAASQYPPEEGKLTVLKPGEKKTFTGKGFVAKKSIPRIMRGRGRLGMSNKQRVPRKESVR